MALNSQRAAMQQIADWLEMFGVVRVRGPLCQERERQKDWTEIE
jgi:hypothetical protein